MEQEYLQEMAAIYPQQFILWSTFLPKVGGIDLRILALLGVHSIPYSNAAEEATFRGSSVYTMEHYKTGACAVGPKSLLRTI